MIQNLTEVKGDGGQVPLDDVVDFLRAVPPDALEV